MSVEVDRATLPCGVCGAAVTELRRGRCWGCYSRWAESRPVGRGAACTICQEKRRNQLKLVELKGRSLPFCHGCAAQVLRMLEMPDSVDELRHDLRRERREPTAATARSTSASSRANAGWASDAARRARRSPTPTRACGWPSSTTSIIELEDNEIEDSRADATVRAKPVAARAPAPQNAPTSLPVLAKR